MKRKYFGGYVSVRQALYLIFAVMSILLFFLPFIDILIKIILFLTIVGVCTVFAFLKIDETNADKYFIYIFKFLVKRKIYILER